MQPADERWCTLTTIHQHLAHRHATTLVLVTGFALCAANIVRHHARAWDDAYISFRFASHLAAGEGLVWNLNGGRVEGYTSVLHVLVLAAARRAGLDLESFALGLSVAATLATAFVMVRNLRRRRNLLPLAAALPIALYLADERTAIHATSRLETPLFLLLLAVGIEAAMNLVDAPRLRNAAWLAATTFLTVLCRPEGALYGAGVYVVLFAWSSRPRDRVLHDLRRSTVISAAMTISLAAVYAAWKYSYFGYLLPNPYYVKSNRVSLHGIGEVVAYLTDVAWRFGVPTLAVCLLTVATDRSIAALRRSLWVFVMLLLPAALALGYYATIIHEVGGADRFSFPTIVHVALAAGYVGLASGGSFRVEKNTSWRAMVQPLMLLGAIAWVLIWQPGFDPRPRSCGAFVDYHWRIATALRDTGLGPTATVLTDAAGVIPYVSGFNQIDRIGLTDNYLSGRIPRQLAEREAYIWGLAPDVYIGYEPPASVGRETPGEDPIMKTPYVATILLERPLATIEDRIFLQDADLLHQRMRELRDHWDWMGEIEWPGWNIWHLKSFAYVRKGASASLPAGISAIVARRPADVVLDDVPSSIR